MKEITFGRDRYIQYPQMQKWCEENIGGSGGWCNLDDYNLARVWSINILFGYTTLQFRNDEDATAFILRWA
jgi:hypothetical protein